MHSHHPFYDHHHTRPQQKGSLPFSISASAATTNDSTTAAKGLPQADKTRANERFMKLIKHYGLYESKEHQKHYPGCGCEEVKTIKVRSVMANRPELAMAKLMIEQPNKWQDLIEQTMLDGYNGPNDEYADERKESNKRMRSHYMRELGNVRYLAKDYHGALKLYIDGVRSMLGARFVIPATDIGNRIYREMKSMQALDLIALANNIAQCFVWMNDRVNALEWQEEVRVLCEMTELGRRPEGSKVLFHWQDPRTNIEEAYTGIMKSNFRSAQLLRSLGNTSAAFERGWLAFCQGNEEFIDISEECPQSILKLRKEASASWTKWSKYRLHPDPTLLDLFQVQDERLQIRGSWKKLKTGMGMGNGNGPPARLGHCYFTWKGTFYIFGGQHGSDIPPYRDGWALKLSSMTWRKLDGRLPVLRLPSHNRAVTFDCLQMRVHPATEKAYVFYGSRTLYRFDLRTEKWDWVDTQLERGGKKSQWPYQSNIVNHAMEIFDDHLYIFGGMDYDGYAVGNNLMMACNLKTFRWKHLGGTAKPKPTAEMPMLREFCQSWVIPYEAKIYVMMGNSARSRAKLWKQECGNVMDRCYSDLWSYHCVTGKWRKERMRGNPPSSRTEFSSVYNPVLDRVIIFGGYNPGMVTAAPRDSTEVFGFSYFADCFSWSLDTRSFSQIMTRSFPTYRAQASLFCDEETGRTYLFGGYSVPEYVPCQNVASAVSFADTWELVTEAEDGNGGLTEEDMKEEKGPAAPGSWKRCYNCGSVGRWASCGGTCGGRIQFCTTHCQKQSWSTHKTNTGCAARKDKGKGKGK